MCEFVITLKVKLTWLKSATNLENRLLFYDAAFCPKLQSNLNNQKLTSNIVVLYEAERIIFWF